MEPILHQLDSLQERLQGILERHAPSPSQSETISSIYSSSISKLAIQQQQQLQQQQVKSFEANTSRLTTDLQGTTLYNNKSLGLRERSRPASSSTGNVDPIVVEVEKVQTKLLAEARNSVGCCLRRLDQKTLDRIFDEHKSVSGDSDSIPAEHLRTAALEIYTEEEIKAMDIEAQFAGNATIDQEQWELLAARQTPLDEWVASLPLGSLVASALTPLVGYSTATLPRQLLMACSEEQLRTVCSELADGLTQLLARAIKDLAAKPRPSCGLHRTGGIRSDGERTADALFNSEADDAEVIEALFGSMADAAGQISDEAIDAAAERYKHDADMCNLLAKMRSKSPVTLDALKSLVKETPRLSGQRIVWSASLSLECLLARHLDAGSLFDGLNGIKVMKPSALNAACRRFSAEMPRIVEREWVRMKQINTDSRGKVGFEGVMNKFMDEGGFLGRFGDEDMFHAGLESKIGYPNPKLFRAILVEHCFSADSDDVVVTGNYGLAFTPAQEFARIFGKAGHPPANPQKLPSIQFLAEAAAAGNGFKGPTAEELREVSDELRRLQKVYDAVMKRKNSVFPGEVGDEHQEHICDVILSAENEDEAKKTSEELPVILRDLSEKYADFLCGKVDKKGKRPDMDVLDAEAVARGIKLVGTAKAQQSDVIATMSVPISQKERRETFKLADALRDVLALKQKKFNAVTPKETLVKTWYFVEDLTLFGPQASEAAQLQSLETLSLKELQAKAVQMSLVATSVRGKQAPDKKELIDSIKQKMTSMSFCKQSRRSLTLMELMNLNQVKEGQLRVEEAMVVYQYTGPLFQIWNGLLRQIPNIVGNRYTTTVHVLVSAVLKLSKTTKGPPGRRVYRGLGGMVLDEKWFKSNERNTRGGVELGFLSTTLNQSTALEYSGVKKGRGIVLEIDVGAIDCGADLKELSQYPGEGELLFSPLSYLEVVGMPRFQIFDQKQVVIVQVRININLKAQIIEDMISKRRQMHLAAFDFLKDSIKYDILKIAEEDNVFNERIKEDKFRKNHTLNEFVEDVIKQVDKRREVQEKIKSTQYLDNDVFRGLVIDMLDTAAHARSKMHLYLMDKSLYIRDVSNLSLSAAHRMRIAYCTKNLPEAEDSKRDAAEALCRLKGLQSSSNEQQKSLALLSATANGMSMEDLKLLLDSGIDIDHQDEDGSTAVYIAAQCGNVRCIQSLVDLGASVNIRDNEDRTPLFAAAKIGSLECVKLLVEKHADVNLVDKQKSTALMVAAAAGYFDCVEELANMNSGGQIEMEQLKPEMLSALTVAIEKGQVKVVQYIMKLIANKDHVVDMKDFHDFCVPLLKRIDLKAAAVSMLSAVGINAKEDDDLENFVNSFYDDFVKTILAVKPYLGNMLFRFCDVDKNESVTEAEVLECLQIYMAVAASNDITSEFSGFAKAIFRVFDLNGDGTLEQEEIAVFATELFAELHRLVKGISTHFQHALKDNRKPIHEMLSKGMGIVMNDVKWPFPMDELTSELNSVMTGDDLNRILSEFNGSFPGPEEYPEEIQQFARAAYQSLSEIRDLANAQLQNFFSQVIEVAKDGSMTSEDTVRFGLTCVKQIFEGFGEHSSTLMACVLKIGMFLIQRTLEDMPSENPLKFTVIDEELVKDILNAAVSSVASHLQEVGMQRYLEALSLVFAGEDGCIKGQVLRALHNITGVVFELFDEEGVRSKLEDKKFTEGLEQSISALLKNFDENENGLLEESEILSFVDKILQFILSAFDATIDFAAKIIMSTVAPVLAFCFDLKVQVIGGSQDVLKMVDLSSVALALGMAMGQHQVIKFALDVIGNESGNVDEKTLQGVCFPLFKLFLGSPPARAVSTQIFSALGEAFQNREFAAKIHNSLVDKVEAICPVISKMIFRVLDLDRNGTVTKSEVEEFINIVQDLDSDSSQAKQFVSVAHAGFRVLDLDGDGNINAHELTESVREIFDALFEMIFGLLEQIENIILSEPLENIVDQFMNEMTGEDNSETGLSLKQMVSNMNSGLSDEDLVMFISLIADNLENLLIPDEENEDMMNLVAASKGMYREACKQYQSFFLQATRSSADNIIKYSDLVRISSDCAMNVLDSIKIFAEQSEACIMKVVMMGISALMTDMPDDAPLKYLAIKPKFIQTFFECVFGTLYNNLKSRGVTRYFESLLKLFDPHNSGTVKILEILALKGLADAAFMNKDGTAVKNTFEEFQESLIKMIAGVDIGCDAILGKAEVISCVKAVAKFAFMWVKISIEMLDKTLVGAITPAANLLMNIKSQVLGGSESSLTHADVCSAILAIGLLERETEVIGYLKELLIYKESDVDAQVFTNLCSNLVRLFFFWAPDARQTSREFLSSFAELVDWEPSEESFAGFHKKIMDESACICPFLGQALFRFFDMDKSGNVTASEVTATLDLIQGLMDGTETDAVKVSKAIFRIFDTDFEKNEEDASIKIEEMYKFIAEVLELLSTLTNQILAHLQDAITGEPLNQALQLFCEHIEGENTPGLYPVPSVVDYFSKKYSNQFLSEVLDQVRGLWEQFSSQPRLENIKIVCVEQANEFLKRVKDGVSEEKLQTASVALIASECAKNILSCIVHESDKVMALIMDQLPHLLEALSFKQRGEEVFKEKKIDGNNITIKFEYRDYATKSASKRVLKSILIPFTSIHKIVKSSAEALRQRLDNNSLSKFSNSAAHLLDPTNTDGVSKADFELLLNLIFALLEPIEDEDSNDIKARFDSLLAAWCSLSARTCERQDSIPSLNFEGVLASVKAVLRLAFIIAEEVVAATKGVVLHAANPVLELALYIKSQISGSEGELTFQDIEKLKKIFETD